jgi:hypothetical protein
MKWPYPRVCIGRVSKILFRSLAPEFRHEKDDDGVDLQPSQEHAEDEDPFSKERNVKIVLHRADRAETRAHIENAGGHRRKGRDEVKTQ